MSAGHCSRCKRRHAERRRERYHTDPKYRAVTLEHSRLWRVRERARSAA